jgi:hypothetical protein
MNANLPNSRYFLLVYSNLWTQRQSTKNPLRKDGILPSIVGVSGMHKLWWQVGIAVMLNLFLPMAGLTLPPPEEPAEEVLRAEIYTSARSLIDGRWLSAQEYLEELHRLAQDTIPPEYYVSQELRELMGLLRLRRFIRRILPIF